MLPAPFSQGQESAMQNNNLRHAASRFSLAVLFALTTLPAAAIQLVTPQELAADRAAPDAPLTRALPVPGAPLIELDAPKLDASLKSPIDIKLRWTAEEGAAVQTNSLRILYGRLGLDITKRVAASLKVTATGMEVTGAELPSGKHRIKIEVSDDRKRIGSRTFEVTVADK
jgi:hypothetical protein